MTRSISTSQRRWLAPSAALVLASLLAACGTTGKDSAASASMTTNAALGSVYFGDIMAFGPELSPQAPTLVAATITLEY